MKRIITVLAFLLILILGLSGDAYSLSRPYNDPMIGPSGEDHPWGGEEVIDDPYSQNSTVTAPTTYITGIFGIDLLFRQFIISDSFQSWFIKETQESYYRQIIVKDEAINTKTYIDIDIIKGNK